MQTARKKQVVADLLSYLQDFVLADRIELLSQLMIQWGVERILLDSPELIPNHRLEPEEVLELVATDKRKGESLGGALAHQGLLMLMWLEAGEKHVERADS